MIGLSLSSSSTVTSFPSSSKTPTRTTVTAFATAAVYSKSSLNKSSFNGVRVSPISSSVQITRRGSSSVVMMAKREDELEGIREKTTEQINEEIIDLKGELFMLLLQRAARNEFKSSEFRRMRKKIEGMKDEVKYYWKSFEVSQSNEDLWSKEWNKHGVFSEHVLDQHTYFQRGLEITKRYDLVAILGRAGIVPNDNAYSVEEIKSALEKGLMVTPEISCHFNATKHYVLSEIRIWFDASAMNPMNCMKPVCQETTIYFMAY